MNDFIHCNKVSGIYWINKPIKKLKIKINLKPVSGIISLPKFEDYDKETNSIDSKLAHKVEEHVFEWQEKKFSNWEIHIYGDSLNCETDRDLAYHEILKNVDSTACKIFSYVNEDNYVSFPFDYKKKNKEDGSCLSTIFNYMLLKERFGIFGGKETTSNSALHIFKSEETRSSESDEWTAMHIVYDNSEYDEYSQLLSKQEAIFVSLYYNMTNNYLIISPDSNNLEFNPYELITESGIRLNYHYGVDISFDDEENGEDLMILLKKLHKKWLKKQKHLLNFVMPIIGVKKYYITLEIITAAGFEMDNLYVEYNIKVPQNVVCNDALHGKTHTSKSTRVDNLDRCNFGHILDLELEINSNSDPPLIKIFFEVISLDWWNRHRTEGYSYIALSLTPGTYAKQLSCSRPEEANKVESESRRFFVGGCHLIKDLEVLVNSHLMDTNFTYETTGTIELRWNVVSQSAIPGSTVVSSQSGTSTSSALLHGADTALRKYSKARAKLAAATKDLEVTYVLET